MKAAFDRQNLEVRRRAIRLVEVLGGLSIDEARIALQEADSFILCCTKVDVVNNEELQGWIKAADEWESMLKKEEAKGKA